MDAAVFSELPGDGGSLRERGGQGRSHCKGKQSDVGIWGWRRGLLGGWSGLELEPGGVWESGSSGPSPPALSGLPLDCDHLLRCSTLNVGKDIYERYMKENVFLESQKLSECIYRARISS